MIYRYNVRMFGDLFRWFSMNLRYFGKPPWDTGQSPPELIEFIQNHPTGRALDVGCGTGTNCLTLAEAGWHTTGVDIAWKALRKARTRFAERGLAGDFHAGSVVNFNARAGAFDLVLDIGCFHSLSSSAKTVYTGNIVRWLKPNGYFLIYGHRSCPKKPNQTWLTEQDIERFSDAFTLEYRKDSTDRWGRETIWLLFKKPDQ